MNSKKVITTVIVLALVCYGVYTWLDSHMDNEGGSTSSGTSVATLEDFPEYNGQPYLEINKNKPN